MFYSRPAKRPRRLRQSRPRRHHVVHQAHRRPGEFPPKSDGKNALNVLHPCRRGQSHLVWCHPAPLEQLQYRPVHVPGQSVGQNKGLVIATIEPTGPVNGDRAQRLHIPQPRLLRQQCTQPVPQQSPRVHRAVEFEMLNRPRQRTRVNPQPANPVQDQRLLQAVGTAASGIDRLMRPESNGAGRTIRTRHRRRQPRPAIRTPGQTRTQQPPAGLAPAGKQKPTQMRHRRPEKAPCI